MSTTSAASAASEECVSDAPSPDDSLAPPPPAPAPIIPFSDSTLTSTLDEPTAKRQRTEHTATPASDTLPASLDATTQHAAAVSSGSSSEAVTAVNANAESAAAASEQIDVQIPKRLYPCRICGHGLSSASNRLRHERAKHKPQLQAEPTIQARAPSITRPTAAAIRTPAKRPRTAVLSVASSSSNAAGPLGMFEAADEEKEEVEGQPDEEEDDDVELQQFVAAVANSSLQRSPAVQHEEENKCDDSNLTESLSGSDAASYSTDNDASGTGLRAPLTDEALQAGCFSFLQWLTLPPLTQAEVLVKVRKVKSMAQLHPIKCSLRFIFALLHQRELTDTADLRVLTRLHVCRALYDALNERGCGAARFHAIFLLVKKVLIHLSSQESTQRRQFLLPTMYESFLFVDGVCSDSGQQRKQESRNRALLGVHATQQLQNARHSMQPPQPFCVPAVWSAHSQQAAESTPDEQDGAAAGDERLFGRLA